MTVNYQLKLTLESDATFGRGEGAAGEVDVEIVYDEAGFPMLGGRTLKGLLGAECADLLDALSVAASSQQDRWRASADHLFGTRGAGLQGEAIMQVGAAQLPDDLRAEIKKDIAVHRITARDVLDIFTETRRQTAMDETGAPKQETLRAMRVIVRGLTFDAPLVFVQTPSADDLGLLAATVKALRRIGLGRNRGLGKVTVTLCDGAGGDVTETHFAHFRKAVNG